MFQFIFKLLNTNLKTKLQDKNTTKVSFSGT
eukprot:UN33094